MKTSAQNTPATVITRNELIAKFLEMRGNTFVTCSVETSVKLKGGNPFGEVKQKQNLNGAVGFSYIGSVNRQEVKAEVENITEEAKPLAWGTLSDNRIVRQHTNKAGEFKQYLEMKIESRPNAKDAYYFDPNTGETLDTEAVKEWKYASKKSSTQSQLPEGVEVVVRAIDFANIKEITLNGNHFVITD